MSRVLPKMKHYFGDVSHPNAHGFPASPAVKAVIAGYYTKAPDNRPIIGMQLRQRGNYRSLIYLRRSGNEGRQG